MVPFIYMVKKGIGDWESGKGNMISLKLRDVIFHLSPWQDYKKQIVLNGAEMKCDE